MESAAEIYWREEARPRFLWKAAVLSEAHRPPSRLQTPVSANAPRHPPPPYTPPSIPADAMLPWQRDQGHDIFQNERQFLASMK